MCLDVVGGDSGAVSIGRGGIWSVLETDLLCKRKKNKGKKILRIGQDLRINVIQDESQVAELLHYCLQYQLGSTAVTCCKTRWLKRQKFIFSRFWRV